MKKQMPNAKNNFSLHAFHHDTCVGLNGYVTTGCKVFLHRPMVCVLPTLSILD